MMRVLNNRAFLLGVLVLLFAVNYAENVIESRFPIPERALAHAAALSQMEQSPRLFAGHEHTGPTVVYGASVIYFFVFPLGMVVFLVAYVTRPAIAALRVISAAFVIDYLLSVIFYLFLPLPERWYYAESGAALLSNNWTYSLIAFSRPFSGLTHCFPSFHTSAVVIVAAVCCAYRSRFRWTSVGAAVLVVLSTVLLGIHWFSDIVGGIGVALLSTAVAMAIEPALARAAGPLAQSSPVSSGLAAQPLAAAR